MKPEHIIIHHSLTADSQTVSWNAIRRYHVETLGWRDIGYHFGIELVGTYYEILAGRMLTEPGAHCHQQNMNRKSIGICCVGNFDQDALPDGQLARLVQLTTSLMEVFDIPPQNVERHSTFAHYKSCPGTKFPWDRFKSAIRI